MNDHYDRFISFARLKWKTLNEQTARRRKGRRKETVTIHVNQEKKANKTIQWTAEIPFTKSKMISSISVASSAGANGNSLAYAQLNNNGYMMDENLNATQQSDRLQYVSKPFNATFDNEVKTMATIDDSNAVKYSAAINHGSVIVANQWYTNATKKAPIMTERQLSTDDSDSSGSSKNGGSDHLQQMHACNSNKCDEEKPMPDHHARRPMNAFLIFCKRHRGIVRERYPNLENR